VTLWPLGTGRIKMCDYRSRTPSLMWDLLWKRALSQASVVMPVPVVT